MVSILFPAFLLAIVLCTVYPISTQSGYSMKILDKPDHDCCKKDRVQLTLYTKNNSTGIGWTDKTTIANRKTRYIMFTIRYYLDRIMYTLRTLVLQEV